MNDGTTPAGSMVFQSLEKPGCGATMAGIVSATDTQMVVTAGVGTRGLGDMRVFSTSYGEAVRSNTFSYTASDVVLTIASAVGRQRV